MVVRGVASSNEYATGWIKRGLRGVIDTNHADANDTMAAVVRDVPILGDRRVGAGTAIGCAPVRGALRQSNRRGGRPSMRQRLLWEAHVTVAASNWRWDDLLTAATAPPVAA